MLRKTALSKKYVMENSIEYRMQDKNNRLKREARQTMELFYGRPENTEGRQQTKFYLLMMPGDKPFKTKELIGKSTPFHITASSYSPAAL